VRRRTGLLDASELFGTEKVSEAIPEDSDDDAETGQRREGGRFSRPQVEGGRRGVTFSESDNAVVFRNDDGEWTVSKRRGYITRYARANGMLICADAESNDWVLNNPCHGALGAFGCHIARRNEWYPNLEQRWNFSWDLTERRDAAADGFGIVRVAHGDGPRLEDGKALYSLTTFLSDGPSHPNAILSVQRRYVIEPDNVKCFTTVTSEWDGTGPELFIKEPKLVAHSIGSLGETALRFRYLDVFDRGGRRLRNYDLWLLPDPEDKTLQIGNAGRARVRFRDAAREVAFNVVMEGSDGNVRQPWSPATVGFDKWAEDANAAERFLEHGPRYCLKGPGGTLTRQWEATRFSVLKVGERRPAAERGTPIDPDPKKPQVGVMFHAWEGGTGYPDCFNASRRMPSRGTRYTVYSCYSDGPGWQV
jgi:hypothetical protein